MKRLPVGLEGHALEHVDGVGEGASGCGASGRVEVIAGQLGPERIAAPRDRARFAPEWATAKGSSSRLAPKRYHDQGRVDQPCRL